MPDAVASLHADRWVVGSEALLQREASQEELPVAEGASTAEAGLEAALAVVDAGKFRY